MFCSNCGKEIDDKAVVCINCGCETNNKNKQQKGSNGCLGCLIVLIGFLMILGIIFISALYATEINDEINKTTGQNSSILYKMLK